MYGFFRFSLKTKKHILILEKFYNQEEQANKYVASFFLPNNQPLQLTHMVYIMQAGISI